MDFEFDVLLQFYRLFVQLLIALGKYWLRGEICCPRRWLNQKMTNGKCWRARKNTCSHILASGACQVLCVYQPQFFPNPVRRKQHRLQKYRKHFPGYLPDKTRISLLLKASEETTVSVMTDTLPTVHIMADHLFSSSKVLSSNLRFLWSFSRNSQWVENSSFSLPATTGLVKPVAWSDHFVIGFELCCTIWNPHLSLLGSRTLTRYIISLPGGSTPIILLDGHSLK